MDDSTATPAKDPLIAELAPLSTLRADYEGGSESFIKQIDSLKDQGFEGIRRSRGDGDCFYRCGFLSLSSLPTEILQRRALDWLLKQMDAALVFAYIERIFAREDRDAAVKASLATLEAFLPKLLEVGFEQMVIDDSYEIPRDLINGIVDPEPVSNNGSTLTRAQLLEVFQDDSSACGAPLHIPIPVYGRYRRATDARPRLREKLQKNSSQCPIIW